MVVLATMPFISIDWTIVFQLLNTLILFLALRHFLFEPIKNMMDSREAEVAQIYDDANADRAEAERVKAEYIQSLSGAREEAEQIVRQATESAKLRSDEIVFEAKSEAQHLRERANQEIEQEKVKAMNEIKDEISDIAILLASKVIDKDLNQQDHEQLISEFIENVGDTSWKA